MRGKIAWVLAVFRAIPCRLSFSRKIRFARIKKKFSVILRHATVGFRGRIGRVRGPSPTLRRRWRRATEGRSSARDGAPPTFGRAAQSRPARRPATTRPDHVRAPWPRSRADGNLTGTVRRHLARRDRHRPTETDPAGRVVMAGGRGHHRRAVCPPAAAAAADVLSSFRPVAGRWPR